MTTKEAQIALANLKRYISGGGAVDRGTNKAIDMAIKALEKPDTHWHPVSEQPQEDDDYLLLTHEKTKYGTFKRIIIGAWNGATKEWLEEYEGMYRDVNHPVAWISKEELLLLKGWEATE